MSAKAWPPQDEDMMLAKIADIMESLAAVQTAILRGHVNDLVDAITDAKLAAEEIQDCALAVWRAK